ncbi:PleD family two-component system response regulator [Pedobacter aquatilis]|uniref:response regulator n=1 Tax=Pedobacter aquatilis TaxID=351343 RepID=UPI0029303C3D|nr:response regulator [Pedobacter aquatilis]
MQKKILVVDDDKLLLNALEQYLSEAKFEVRALSEPSEINNAIIELKPDLIILDIRLGEEDGRLICDDLKKSKSTAHIPVILLTGLIYDDIAEIDCEADAIIGKPYEWGSLLSTIKQLI